MKKILVFIKTKLNTALRLNAYFNQKRGSTYSGALSYFLFTGLIPFIALLIYALARFNLAEKFTEEFLQGYFPNFEIMQTLVSLAQQRSSTIIMLIVGIYTSANFYLHVIHLGEKFYGKRDKQAVAKRVLAFLYLLLIILLFLACVIIEMLGKRILLILNFNSFLSNFISFALNLLLSFVLSLLLHHFAYQQKTTVKSLLNGILLTFILWQIIGGIFSLYLRFFSRDTSLISSVLIFLLYLNFLMRALVYGIALNALKM